MTDAAQPPRKRRPGAASRRGLALATSGRAPGPPRGEALALLRARRWLASSAFGMLAGVALVATGESTVGPWASLLSMLLAVGSAHALGRCGPDTGARA